MFDEIMNASSTTTRRSWNTSRGKERRKLKSTVVPLWYWRLAECHPTSGTVWGGISNSLQQRWAELLASLPHAGEIAPPPGTGAKSVWDADQKILHAKRITHGVLAKDNKSKGVGLSALKPCF